MWLPLEYLGSCWLHRAKPSKIHRAKYPNGMIVVLAIGNSTGQQVWVYPRQPRKLSNVVPSTQYSPWSFCLKEGPVFTPSLSFTLPFLTPKCSHVTPTNLDPLMAPQPPKGWSPNALTSLNRRKLMESEQLSPALMSSHPNNRKQATNRLKASTAAPRGQPSSSSLASHTPWPRVPSPNAPPCFPRSWFCICSSPYVVTAFLWGHRITLNPVRHPWS
jgi:hypothetical protein